MEPNDLMPLVIAAIVVVLGFLGYCAGFSDATRQAKRDREVS